MSRPGFDFVPVNMNDSDDETEKKEKKEKSAKPAKKEEEELVVSEANLIPLVARGQKPRPVVAEKKTVAVTKEPTPVVTKKTVTVTKEPVPVLAKKSEPAQLKSALKPASKKPAPKEPESESDEEMTGGEESEDDDEDDGLVENLDDLEDLSDDDEMDDDEYDSETGASGPNSTKKRVKRNDPTAFANSMSKILASKLSTSKRSDPVLSRSVDAATASKELIDQRLEAKAKRQLYAEKRQALDKGRVKDVLGLESVDVSTAHIQEQERRLKKTAQRGVIKLFNAVRAAQVKGEQARAEAKKAGVVGISQREERVSEMSKKGFLDLLAQGGKKAPAINVQEA